MDEAQDQDQQDRACIHGQGVSPLVVQHIGQDDCGGGGQLDGCLLQGVDAGALFVAQDDAHEAERGGQSQADASKIQIAAAVLEDTGDQDDADECREDAAQLFLCKAFFEYQRRQGDDDDRGHVVAQAGHSHGGDSVGGEQKDPVQPQARA